MARNRPQIAHVGAEFQAVSTDPEISQQALLNCQNIRSPEADAHLTRLARVQVSLQLASDKNLSEGEILQLRAQKNELIKWLKENGVRFR